MDKFMDIKTDFMEDWKEIVLKHLKDVGYSQQDVKEVVQELSSKNNYDDVMASSIVFYNQLKRRIPQKPREVHKSQGFNCPQGLETGLATLEGKIRNGDDLNPHLSRNIKRVYHNDALLNDWGISHFHLGETLGTGDSMMKRTGPLLFAKVTENAVYLIEVLQHGDWAMQELIQSIHDNWPGLLKDAKIEEKGELAYQPTNNEVKELRNEHLNPTIMVRDGTAYNQPGGGVTSTGDSIEVTKKSQRVIGVIGDFQTRVQNRKSTWINEVLKVEATQSVTSPIHLKLWVKDKELATGDIKGPSVSYKTKAGKTVYFL